VLIYGPSDVDALWLWWWYCGWFAWRWLSWLATMTCAMMMMMPERADAEHLWAECQASQSERSSAAAAR
jgi:hypothetical protein